MRLPGSVRSRRASTARSSAFTAGELRDARAGSVTTGSNGALLPPVPWKSRAIRWLVTQPSLPGTENFCFSALLAVPEEAMPTRVSTTQKMTTVRLWARTQRVSDAMCAPSFAFVVTLPLGG
jgi:hypothetical protein